MSGLAPLGFVSAAVLVSCDAQTIGDGAGQGGAGDGPSSSSASTASTSTTQASSSTGASTCPAIDGTLFFELTLSELPSASFDAIVHRDDQRFELDPCAPDDVACTLVPVTVTAQFGALPTLDQVGLLDGAFVHVEDGPRGTLVTNLPTLHDAENPVAMHTSVWLYVGRGAGETASSLPPYSLGEGLVLTHEVSCNEQMTHYTWPTLTDALSGETVTGTGVLIVGAGPQMGSFRLAGRAWAHVGSGFSEVVARLEP